MEIIKFKNEKHKQYIGRICKVSLQGVALEKIYEEVLGISTYAEKVYEYCHFGGKFEMSLMFIDEPPMVVKGETFYCLLEVGIGVSGDWHWFTLNQLIICN